jgi:hypothetical protein
MGFGVQVKEWPSYVAIIYARLPFYLIITIRFNDPVPTWHSLCVSSFIFSKASNTSLNVPDFVSLHFLIIRNLTTAMLLGWLWSMSFHSLSVIPRCNTRQYIIVGSNWSENLSISESLGFWSNASSLRPEIMLWELKADTDLYHLPCKEGLLRAPHWCIRFKFLIPGLIPDIKFLISISDDVRVVKE